jgi:hypothetical protein
MATEFHFNQLDPVNFQRLINAILTARYGDPVRLSPLRGRDGGRDAELPDASAFHLRPTPHHSGLPSLNDGLAVFQVKHHRTLEGPLTAARAAVIADFTREFVENVLPRLETEPIRHFFLVTNVPASHESLEKVEQKRDELFVMSGQRIMLDVLWGEHVTAWLDQHPQIWPSYPDLFAGKIVPALAAIATDSGSSVARAYRLALTTQFQRDRIVRFRQIELEEQLSRLFIDLDLGIPEGASSDLNVILATLWREAQQEHTQAEWRQYEHYVTPQPWRTRVSCLRFFGTDRDLPEDRKWPRRIILEGGPGQGKSTLTQMLAQVYRSILLNNVEEYSSFHCPDRARLPFRIELRLFAEWLKAKDGTVEEYLSQLISKDAGGAPIRVEDLHALIEGSAAAIIFDGLDEVGSDELRDAVLTKITESVERLEALDKGLRAIVTTRPPAIAGKSGRLPGFVRLHLLPLEPNQVDEYVGKWTRVFCSDLEDRERVTNSFNKRRNEVHVTALAKNPMQLSVLLQFIRFKGEAFPDRRAELYRDYFRTVIDRDVEKTPRLLSMRTDIETLHEVIGFKIHSLAESDKASSSLSRKQLITIVEDWLHSEDRPATMAQELFKLGEERLGLIIAVAGEAGETRYGFEIQPVREYFAAAYINERVAANAHDFFQVMVRRPFWREVALFLAGLRRANEKADLLLRAKALDEDSELGWRQDGTSTILELLQEGVLSSPGHVHRNAVSFMLRLLNPTDCKPKNEPKALLHAIPSLVRNCGLQQHIGQLQTFLHEGRTSKDRGALEPLHRVAYSLLDSSVCRQHISEFPVDTSLISAEVHIAWPRAEKVDLYELSKSAAFWPDIPNSTWASVWWRVGRRESLKTNLAGVSAYHRLLVEQFTYSSIPLVIRKAAVQREQPVSRWAIWWLNYFLRTLCNALLGLGEPSLQPSVLPDEMDCSGLDQALSGVLQDLLRACMAACHSIAESETDSGPLAGLLECLSEHLTAEGLAGWVACRCAISLLEVSANGRRVGYLNAEGEGGGVRYIAERTPPVSRHFSRLQRLGEWKNVRQLVTPFFRHGIERDVDASGRSQAGRLVRQGWSDVSPTHIRLKGEMVPVIELFRRYLTEEITPHAQFLESLPIPQCWFRELILSKELPLSKLLPEIARRHTLRGPHVPLSVQAMRRVLGFAKRSIEAVALSGSLVALLSSRFLALADDELLLKMIHADRKYADTASHLFEIRQREPSEFIRVVNLAQTVLGSNVVVSRRTGNAAAACCTQNLPVNFRPLASELQLDRLTGTA